MNKNIICALISENLIKEAIDELRVVFQDSYHYNDVIQESNRFHEFEKKRIRGTESFEELNRIHAKIIDSLLTLTDKIPKNDFNKYNFVERLSEWRIEISKHEKERTGLLKKIATEKAKELDYKIETIDAISTAYSELIENAFQHGCSLTSDKVTINFEITSEYIAIKVSNPITIAIEFELKEKINECIKNIENNPFQKRGRGLILINELCDEFVIVDENTFKVVFYNDNCDFLIREIDSNLILIDVVSGIENPAFSKKLTYIVNHLTDDNYSEVMLSFRAFTQSRRSTVITTITIELNEMLASQCKKFVAIVRQDDRILTKVRLPNLISTNSWADAVNKIGRPNILERLHFILEDVINKNSKYRYLLDT